MREPRRVPGIQAPDFAFAAALGAALAWLHARTLFGGRVYFSGELTYISQPWLALTTEQLQRGQIPLWNPYGLFGMPWLGCMQTGMFHPTNLIFHLFPLGRSLTWHFLASSGLGAFWTALWLRRRGLGRLPSWSGAALFALGGGVAGQLEFPHQVATLVHLPALFLFLDHPALLGLAAAAAFLAGYPPKWGGAMLCVLALAAVRLPRSPRPGRTLAAVAGACALAAAISAAVILPGLEFLRGSARGAEGVPIEERTYYSLMPVELSSLIHPEVTRRLGWRLETPLRYKEEATWTDADGSVKRFTFLQDHTDLVREPSGIRYHSWNGFYVGGAGFLALLLGWAVLAGNSPGQAAALALAAAGYALLVLGKNTALSMWLWERLPPLRYLRGPDRFLWLHLAATPWLAALGVSRLRNLPGGRVWGWAACAAIAAELLWTAAGYYPTMPAGYFTDRGPFIEFLSQRLGQARYLQFKAVPLWAYVDREVPGEDYRRYKEAVFLNFREMNFALDGSVFHFGCVSPEKWLPLVPSPSNSVIKRLAGEEFGSFDKLLPAMRWTGIRYILDWTKGPKTTRLIPRGTHLWNVWESPDPVAPAYWIAPEEAGFLSGPLAQAPGNGKALPWEHSVERADRIRIRGRAPRAGVGYVADPFYPGWELYVNGRRTPISRALEAFISFPVAAGEVDGILIYRPGSWALGSAVSLLALGGLALGARRKLRAFERRQA